MNGFLDAKAFLLGGMAFLITKTTFAEDETILSSAAPSGGDLSGAVASK